MDLGFLVDLGFEEVYSRTADLFPFQVWADRDRAILLYAKNSSSKQELHVYYELGVSGLVHEIEEDEESRLRKVFGGVPGVIYQTWNREKKKLTGCMAVNRVFKSEEIVGHLDMLDSSGFLTFNPWKYSPKAKSISLSPDELKSEVLVAFDRLELREVFAMTNEHGYS